MLLKNFSGLSVREKGSIKLIENHLGIRPDFVLDPTLLIDKKYYLDIIKNYKSNISIRDNYIFLYSVTNLQSVTSFFNKLIKENQYKIFWVKDNIKDFIYGIYYHKNHYYFLS